MCWAWKQHDEVCEQETYLLSFARNAGVKCTVMLNSRLSKQFRLICLCSLLFAKKAFHFRKLKKHPADGISFRRRAVIHHPIFAFAILCSFDRTRPHDWTTCLDSWTSSSAFVGRRLLPNLIFTAADDGPRREKEGKKENERLVATAMTFLCELRRQVTIGPWTCADSPSAQLCLRLFFFFDLPSGLTSGARADLWRCVSALFPLPVCADPCYPLAGRIFKGVFLARRLASGLSSHFSPDQLFQAICTLLWELEVEDLAGFFFWRKVNSG